MDNVMIPLIPIVSSGREIGVETDSQLPPDLPGHLAIHPRSRSYEVDNIRLQR
jgi:hypothetical protein